MDVQIVVDYWVENANDAWETALQLVTTKKFHHALFFAQLSLESLIKAYIVTCTNDHPLPVHDLRKLLAKISEPLTQEQIDDLNEITSFCVEARYPEQKKKLYEKATLEYTTIWMNKAKDYSLWIKNKLTQ